MGCLQTRGAFFVDEQAASFLRENQATGRLVVWFDWGEYVSWHFGPALKVSMDGRRETVYSAALLQAHNEFYRNGSGAREFLERLSPDYVWLPKTLPVSPMIAGWGWTPIFETERSTVWARGHLRSDLAYATAADVLLLSRRVRASSRRSAFRGVNKPGGTQSPQRPHRRISACFFRDSEPCPTYAVGVSFPT